MRIDNALSYLMDRRAGSSKSIDPPRYDAADCHECVFPHSKFLKRVYSPSFRNFRVFTKGTPFLITELLFLFTRVYSVWIYGVQRAAEGDLRRGDQRYAFKIMGLEESTETKHVLF
jgi:hypothetical protein